MDLTLNAKLDRNLRLYPWFTGAFDAYCWLPVFFLFFLERVSIQQVLLLESIYYLAVVLLEVPSGYFSDRVGRKKTLIISAMALVVAHSLFLMSGYVDLETLPVFALLAVAQVFLAMGTSFRSGTDTSLHFETLQLLHKSEEYGRREARSGKIGFMAGALAALLGGFVASIELSYAYGASLVLGCITVLIVSRFSEPTVGVSSETSGPAHNFIKQIGACLNQLRNPSLAWLFGFCILMTVLNHVPYEFYQPYLGLLASAEGFLFSDAEGSLFSSAEGSTPMLAGIHTAVTMFAASYVAGWSIKVKDKIGTAYTLVLAACLQAVMIFVMSAVLHPVIAVLLLMRSLPRALMTAPVNAAITPQVPPQLRATYLSLQSLVGRLCFALLLAGLPLVNQITGLAPDAGQWEVMSQMLVVCSGVALIGLILLITRLRKTRL